MFVKRYFKVNVFVFNKSILVCQKNQALYINVVYQVWAIVYKLIALYINMFSLAGLFML